MRTRSAAFTGTPTTPAKVPVRALLRVSLVATVPAAAATETLTAIVRIAGVDLAVGNPGGSPSSVVPVNAGACAIVDTAEELTQDAFVTAIEKRRSEGVPNNPAAWLHKCARFLAVDRIRRRDTLHSKYQQIAATSPQTVDVDRQGRRRRPG